jgi:L-rhamnose isomerase
VEEAYRLQVTIPERQGL